MAHNPAWHAQYLALENAMNAASAAYRRNAKPAAVAAAEQALDVSIASMKAAHLLEENRPIETVWDVVTAATAVARSIPNQDSRVDLERDAGKLLTM